MQRFFPTCLGRYGARPGRRPPRLLPNRGSSEYYGPQPLDGHLHGRRLWAADGVFSLLFEDSPRSPALPLCSAVSNRHDAQPSRSLRYLRIRSLRSTPSSLIPPFLLAPSLEDRAWPSGPFRDLLFLLLTFFRGRGRLACDF